MADNDVTATLEGPIEVTFPGSKRTRVFKSFQEVRKWAEEELKRMEPLDPAKVRNDQRDTIGHYRDLIAGVRDYGGHGIAHTDPSHRYQYTHEIRNRFEKYDQNTLIYFGSPIGKKLLKLFETEPNTVAAMMRVRMDMQPPNPNHWPILIHAAARLALIEEGIESTAREEKEAIADLKAETEGQFEAQMDRFKRTIRASAANAIRASRVRRGLEAKHGLTINHHEAKLLEIEANFKERMALEIPTQYWSQKAGRHKAGFWVTSIVFAWFVGAGIWSAVSYGPEGIQIIQSDSGTSVLSSLLIISVPILAFFWILRLVSRFLNVNLARWQDAQERAVMMQTFLALSEKEQNVMDQSERLLILHALFRPGPGDTPEDAPPPNLLDIINRVTKPGGTGN